MNCEYVCMRNTCYRRPLQQNSCVYQSYPCSIFPIPPSSYPFKPPPLKLYLLSYIIFVLLSPSPSLLSYHYCPSTSLYLSFLLTSILSILPTTTVSPISPSLLKCPIRGVMVVPLN